MRFVDFEGLWKMAIDTPYSLLVSSGSSAWTCGQLAMDENAEVVAPGDLDRQAEIVADYIAEISATCGSDNREGASAGSLLCGNRAGRGLHALRPQSPLR